MAELQHQAALLAWPAVALLHLVELVAWPAVELLHAVELVAWLAVELQHQAALLAWRPGNVGGVGRALFILLDVDPRANFGKAR